MITYAPCDAHEARDSLSGGRAGFTSMEDGSLT